MPCGHAASRRSTVASSTPGPSRRVRTGGLSSPVIQTAFAALHPDRTGLLAKAALRGKGGREPRATRTSCVRTQGRGRHTCSAIKTPHDGALTRAGMPSVQGNKNGTRLIGITLFVFWGRRLNLDSGACVNWFLLDGRGGRALRPRRRARRDTADGARLRQQRDSRADHARPVGRREHARWARKSVTSHLVHCHRHSPCPAMPNSPPGVADCGSGALRCRGLDPAATRGNNGPARRRAEA